MVRLQRGIHFPSLRRFNARTTYDIYLAGGADEPGWAVPFCLWT